MQLSGGGRVTYFRGCQDFRFDTQGFRLPVSIAISWPGRRSLKDMTYGINGGHVC